MALMILAFNLTRPYCSFNSKRYHGDRYIEFLLFGQNFIDLRVSFN